VGRGRTLANRWPAAVVGIVVAGLLVGCGGPPAGTPTPIVTPIVTPTPGPSPTPATTSFLHLRREGGEVATYRIDAGTGRLQLALTQRLGDFHGLAADPAGRYVYLAYGPRSLAESSREDASIVLHEVDPTGRLLPRSEASSRPWPASPGSCTFGEWGWKWLSASAGRAWGLWAYRFGGGCQHDRFIGVTHAVGTDGRLGPAVVGDLGYEFGGAALDPDADVIYRHHYAGYDSQGALTAHAVTPDDRLRITGVSSLCVASEVYEVQPLAAVRGFLFGQADTTGTVCAWEGPRLAPRANLGIAASVAAAFSPADAASPALLAVAEDVYGARRTYRRTDLRLLSVRSDGNAELLDTVELSRRARQLLFDPPGRLLFVADEDGRVLSCAIGPGTRLEPIESVPASARPAGPYDDGPSFVAISFRSSTPRL
jgi:hypothetical protein